MMLTFNAVRDANASRRDRWHAGADEWTGADWGNAMGGECGEAQNVVKKLRRHETGIGSQHNTPPTDELLTALALELADIVLYADLLALHYGLDLAAAVVEKFNSVSAAQNFPERLS